jgi:hypothetical protein
MIKFGKFLSIRRDTNKFFCESKQKNGSTIEVRIKRMVCARCVRPCLGINFGFWLSSRRWERRGSAAAAPAHLNGNAKYRDM